MSITCFFSSIKSSVSFLSFISNFISYILSLLMEQCSSIQTTSAIEVLYAGVKSRRSSEVRFYKPSRTHVLQSQHLYGRRKAQPLIVAVGNTESRSFKNNSASTPRTRSPEGKFLSAVLQNQQHLFQFAVSEQLNALASEKDKASARKKERPVSTESVLHKRIAEMKEKERQTAVEDVIYMSVVHRFSQVEISMVTKLSESIRNNNLEIQPSKYKEIESVHSVEVQEMVKEHLATILHTRGKSSLVDGRITTKIDRLDLGRVYASSVMYGYFLKSASLKREMDLSQAHTYYSLAEIYPCDLPSLRNLGLLRKSEKLSSYVEGFNPEILRRCATLKSREAVNVIEKHTWALFVDESNGEVGSKREIIVSFSSLERLVLEAVAFGSFLWDAERAVDSVYTL